MLVLNNEFEVTGLVSAFHYDFPADFHYSGEAHDGWEFVFAESGSFLVSANSEKIILRTGQVICHKPMEYHSLQPYRGKASAIIFCFHCKGEKMNFFTDKLLNVGRRQRNYLNDIVQDAERILLPKNPLDISRDGYMIKRQTANRLNEQQIKNSIEALLISFCISINNNDEKNTSHRISRKKDISQDIVDYLYSHINGKVNINDIAANFSYSPTSIKKIFRQETGKTIIQYFSDIKIAAAKEMLCEKDKTISEISEQLGFTSAAYFSAFFSKHTGFPPSKFFK